MWVIRLLCPCRVCMILKTGIISFLMILTWSYTKTYINTNLTNKGISIIKIKWYNHTNSAQTVLKRRRFDPRSLSQHITALSLTGARNTRFLQHPSLNQLKTSPIEVNSMHNPVYITAKFYWYPVHPRLAR